jgi:hypothetical protein
MIIEIRGVQFENRGAQLMLWAVLHQLSKRMPKAAVALRLNAGTTLLDLRFISALVKLPLRKRALDLNWLSYWLPDWSKNVLQRRGVVTEASIDAVLDASGFAYGDRWGRGALEASSAELQRFHRYGKPYIFLPQAFGPFRATASAAKHWAVSLTSSPLVAVRDTQSEQALRALMPSTDNLHRFPDITVGLDPIPIETNFKTLPSALLIPNVRLLEQISKKQYLSMMLDIASRLQTSGYRVEIMNHGGKEDTALCLELSRALAIAESRIVENRDPRFMKAVIASANIVVSSRFHACVAALSQGVPCYAIAWTHKYRELFQTYGCQHNVVDVNSALSPGFEFSLPPNSSPNSELKSAARHQRVELGILWDRIFQILGA